MAALPVGGVVGLIPDVGSLAGWRRSVARPRGSRTARAALPARIVRGAHADRRAEV